MSKHDRTSKHIVHRGSHRPANDGWQDVFEGTSVIYTVDRDGHFDYILGDYLVEAMPESWPEQFRAHRQHRKRSGQPVPMLPEESLQDKVLFVFGPKVSAAQAVAALEQVIKNIQEAGLLTGRVYTHDMVWEHIDGSLWPG